jgi:hypothetical protein
MNYKSIPQKEHQGYPVIVIRSFTMTVRSVAFYGIRIRMHKDEEFSGKKKPSNKKLCMAKIAD